MTGVTMDFRAMWRKAVERHADRAAIELATTGATTSYAELHGEAMSLARHLFDAGVAAGDLVGLRLADRRRFCVSLLAVWLADAVPVPLSAAAPDLYVHELIQRLKTAAVLTEQDASPHGVRLALVSETRAESRPTAGLAYVMHTSGSTGRPKSVGLSHQALAAYCIAFATTAGLTSEDRFLQLAPVTFDVVFEELLPIWSVGGTAVLSDGAPEDPGRLLADIQRRRITMAELTTVYWGLLVRYLRASPQPIPPSLRVLFVGGEAASVALIQESLRQGLPVAHVYGVTEAGITSTVQFFEPDELVKTVSVGTPLANSTVYVVNEAGHSVSAGTTGEVWIGGVSLADGYLNDPEESGRRFVEVAGDAPPTGRYYRTGDAGRITAGGQLEILGRLDAQVKVNGIRIDLTEIEKALGSSTLVAEAAVVAVRRSDDVLRLHGFVVPARGSDLQTLDHDLRGLLRQQLPRHLVPERVTVLQTLPITEHGKVDRQALARINDNVQTSSTEALTPSQTLVATGWTIAIGHPPTSVDQNFGDAGGDSLALLSVVVYLEEMGVTVTSTDCLTYPTVRTLAAFLDRTAEHDPSSETPDSTTPLNDHQRQNQRREHLTRRRVLRGGGSW